MLTTIAFLVAKNKLIRAFRAKISNPNRSELIDMTSHVQGKPNRILIGETGLAINLLICQ